MHRLQGNFRIGNKSLQCIAFNSPSECPKGVEFKQRVIGAYNSLDICNYFTWKISPPRLVEITEFLFLLQFTLQKREYKRPITKFKMVDLLLPSNLLGHYLPGEYQKMVHLKSNPGQCYFRLSHQHYQGTE